MQSHQAIVLAAGSGSRMESLSSTLPKSLLPVAGRPMIAHVLERLQRAGIDDVTVVLGYRGGQIRQALNEDAPRGITLHFVENADFLLGNAQSLWAARAAVRDEFALVMADHLLAPELLRALVDAPRGRCKLAVEYAGRSDPRAAEATLALVRNGGIVDLGKGITEWNAMDTGAFWCTPLVFAALIPELRDGELGAVFASLAAAGQLDAVDVTGCAWIDIDTPGDLRQAEALVSQQDATEHLAHAGLA